MLAGLEAVTKGRIWINEREVTRLPPGDRNVAMVFQTYALYPNMTVRQNVGFPLRIRRFPKEEILVKTQEVAQMLGIEELMERKPRELSGGQRQRVALGRAIVRQPDIFLLDEPLSNLDAILRVKTRAELRALFDRLQATVLYVTHDQAEAMALSDRMVVFRDGRIQQVGRPLDVYRRPNNRFVGEFIGSPPMCFFDAVLEGEADSVVVRCGAFRQRVDAAVGFSSPSDTTVTVGVRPEDWIVDVSESDGAAPCLVLAIEHMGSETFLYVESDPIQAVVSVPADTTFRRGDRLFLRFRAGAAHLFDAESGINLRNDV
jgi:multiple sugar transport system ATP-binding protein